MVAISASILIINLEIMPAWAVLIKIINLKKNFKKATASNVSFYTHKHPFVTDAFAGLKLFLNALLLALQV